MMWKSEVNTMTSGLNIQMFGNFSVQYGDNVVDDNGNRMKKVWLLLAYLIFCRNSVTTQEGYLALMQGAGVGESADPGGRLKAVFYRVRTMLNQLDENAGHTWIIRKNGTYTWNPDIPVRLDAEEFEELCRRGAAEGDEDQRLELLRQALELYRGDFLPKLSMEPWVMPIHAYYHQMYIDVVGQVLTVLERRQRWGEISLLCEKALKIEPYSEQIYQYLMRTRIAEKNRAGAMQAFDEMSELLFSAYGVMPSEESRALYRQAAREEESFTVPVGELRDQLREPSGAKGALYCEYDFFKLYYQAQARAIMRSGDTIHIALLSLHGRRGKELARKSLDLAMNNLQNLLISNLRQGDVLTRCSVSQIIIMLPQANYENSCAVCQRLLKAFDRQYPHSPVEIKYSVQPLEPMTAEGSRNF